MDFSNIGYVLLLLLPLINGQGQDDGTATTDAADAAPVVPAVAAATQKVEVSISASEEETVNIGSGAAYSCQISPSPRDDENLLDILKWSHNGAEITARDGPVSVMVDGPSVLLVFSGFSDQETGNYTCTGTYGGETDSKTYMMKAFQDMEFKSESNQFGILGEDGIVKCLITSQPNAEIWWYGDTRISESDDKYRITNEGLIITKLTKDDDKVYTCKGYQRKLNKIKTFPITYQVVEKPAIQGPLTIDPSTPMVGDKVTITCSASGDPTPTYKFMRDSVEVEESKVVNGVYTIESLMQEDEGQYTCTATNIGGTDENTQNLDVLVPPTIELVELINGVEDEIAPIDCIARGDPAPSIKWSRNGEDVERDLIVDTEAVEIEGGNRKEVKSTLTLTLDHTHAGNWTCSATNTLRTVNKAVNVVVQFKPVVEEDLADKVFGWIGHTAVLTCKVSGNPESVLQWSRSGADEGSVKVIEADAQHVIGTLDYDPATFKTQQTLKVDIKNSSQYGTYQCMATNKHGSATHKINIVEAKKPSEPGVHLDEALTSVLKLSVTPPADDGVNGPPITKYIVYYKQDQITGEVYLDPQERTGDVNYVELHHLNSNAAYVVYAKGKSDAGEGPPFDAVFNTKSTSKPVKLTLGGEGERETVETTSYDLTWAEPDNGGSAIQNFTILYEKVEYKDGTNNPKTIGKTEKKTIYGADQRSFKITDLEPGYTYMIKVTATNAIGESNYATKFVTVPSDEEKGTALESSSASLGGGVIAIIIIVILLVVIIVVVIFFVARKRPQLVERIRGRGNRADEEGGAKEGGKDPAEEEKLIKKDEAIKVENEVDPRPPQDEAPQEFEPDNKPEPAVEVSAEKPGDDPAQPLETEIKVTGPENPDKPENPTA